MADGPEIAAVRRLLYNMATAVYSMEPGNVNMSNCFPARSLFRSNGGAGQWLVSPKFPQERRFREVMYSASLEQKIRSESRDVPHQSRRGLSDRTGDKREHVLDADLLMRTHRVKRPSDLCAVDISDKDLSTASPDEFVQFNSVAFINATENRLVLEDFLTFPALRELELSMNGIRRIKLQPGDLPHLEVLDLSYNSVSPNDLTHMGLLPRLRVLHLTANGLTHLPPDLSAPTLNDTDRTMFPSLEILLLDDNKLSHPSLFVSLAGLKTLRLLNLDSNGISAVPYLHQSGEAELSDEGEEDNEETQEQDVAVWEEGLSQGMEEQLNYVVLPNTKDADRTEVIFPTIGNPLTPEPCPRPPGTTISSSILPDFLLSSTEDLIQSFTPPLPNLTTLSLANNKIAHEEDVLAVALFPSLEDLVIYGNPLTSRRIGDSGFLKSFLQQRLGVRIAQKKNETVNKPHLIIPVREKRKVSTHVPKIPKQPLMIDSPLPPFLRLPVCDHDIIEQVMSPSPLPPIRSSAEKLRDTPPEADRVSTGAAETPEEDMSFGSDPTIESVFMTQVDEIPDSPPSTSSGTAHEEQNEVKVREKPQDEEIPEKFRGYEEFYHVTVDPDFIEPVGIQNNVRALEHALKHLLIYQDYKPTLNGAQKPYVSRQSQFRKELQPMARKSKKEALVEILVNMRERSHLTEVPLESALQTDRTSRDSKEAKRLLKELQEKYKSFHSDAVRRAAELEAELRDTAKELLDAQGQPGDRQKKSTAPKTKNA
ncbi:X-ray radiation resistance-associated protein 1 isoform X2 [Hyperolius riggenbachi]|uniref:X-ray radiation resistance-associated protein 1 isoform X2 n=1 Tax=Hyperolius riggenbachi TaxID=752182 RepID=UPI0035A2E7F7